MMGSKKNNEIFEEALKIYSSQNNSDLLTFLTPLIKKFPINNSIDNKKFNHFLALGYALQDKVQEAEKHCLACIEIEPQELDYYYVLSYIYLKIQEFDSCLTYARQFLSIYNTNDSNKNNLTNSQSHKCQIHIILGAAYLELAKYEEALVHYKDAVDTQKTNQLPYLHLVNLYINLNDTESAKQFIKMGIENCTQIHELRLLEKSLDSGNLKLNSENYALIEMQADLFKKEENYEKALQHYEALLHIEPNNIELLYAYSECYLLMGYEDSAMLGFQKILELNPEYKPAQKQLDSISRPVLSH